MSAQTTTEESSVVAELVELELERKTIHLEQVEERISKVQRDLSHEMVAHKRLVFEIEELTRWKAANANN